MKVLHVTHGYYPENTGGVEAYLRMVTAEQLSQGDSVQILTGSIEPREECVLEHHEFDGVPVARLHRNDWYNDHYAHSHHPTAGRLIREFLHDVQPDVVHVHQWIRLTSDLVAIVQGEELPCVVTLHDVYTSCPRAFRVDRDGQPCTRPLSVESCATCVPRFGFEDETEVAVGIELFHRQYRAEVANADRVLVAAGITADLLHATTGAPRDLFTVHELPYRPRFADLPRTAPEVGSGDHPVRFGYWGSLTDHKGPHVLIDAFRAAREHSSVPMELHLFGPLQPAAVKNRMEELTAGLPVTLHGSFEAADLAGAGLDVAVFPVLCFEAFGLGLAEAFELGLPAIVSDIGALAERVGDAGIRVPPGDRGALAEAIARLADDPDHRARLAGKVPRPPIEVPRHVGELRHHYEAARRDTHGAPISIAPHRRADLLLRQRESSRRALRDATGRSDPS